MEKDSVNNWLNVLTQGTNAAANLIKATNPTDNAALAAQAKAETQSAMITKYLPYALGGAALLIVAALFLRR